LFRVVSFTEDAIKQHISETKQRFTREFITLSTPYSGLYVKILARIRIDKFRMD
jgi:hypothetical protein